MEDGRKRGQRIRKEDRTGNASSVRNPGGGPLVKSRQEGRKEGRKERVSSPALSSVTGGMSTKRETFDYQHASSGVIILLPRDVLCHLL